jgi:hypothetical protein
MIGREGALRSAVLRHSTMDCISCIDFPIARTAGTGRPGAPGRNDVKGYVWAACVAVVVALAIVRFTHVMDPIAYYSFLLTDLINRPAMVSQCMIGLNRVPNPQDQAVWKAMGIKDPATEPYLSRLRYCYEEYWGWQRAMRPSG